MADQQRPFAVFDIDGTMIRWQLYHALADAMVKHDLINKESFADVLEARNGWKSRQSLDSFAEYEKSLIQLFDKAIKDLDYLIYQTICIEVVLRYRDQVYTYTRNLIKQLKDDGYLLFAISASPEDLIKLVAEYYGFDDYGASYYEVVNGKLTGNKNILVSGAKTDKLEQLVDKHQATYDQSLAVGDSDGDIKMLEMAHNSIAFNPSRELMDIAKQNHWQIVVERKNVVYQLEYINGQYLLTSPEQYSAAI